MTWRVRPGIRFGELGPLFLLYYEVAPTAADLEKRAPAMRRFLRRGDDCAILSVISARLSPTLPNAAARRVTTEQAQQLADLTKQISVVIEGETLWRSMIRSFLRGQAALRGGAMPMKFYAGVPEAADAAIDVLGLHGVLDANAVVRAIDVLRSEASEALAHDAAD